MGNKKWNDTEIQEPVLLEASDNSDGSEFNYDNLPTNKTDSERAMDIARASIELAKQEVHKAHAWLDRLISNHRSASKK